MKRVKLFTETKKIDKQMQDKNGLFCAHFLLLFVVDDDEDADDDGGRRPGKKRKSE